MAVRTGLQVIDAASPRFAARVAGVVWTSPRRHPRPVHEAEILARATPTDVPFGMGSLAGWMWGDDGPTILLVHGWEGRGSQLAPLVDPLLDAGFRVATFDVPGHGDSAGRRASLVTFADAVAAALRHFGPVQGIVAHSFGGAGVTFALQGSVPDGMRLVFVAPPDTGEGVARFGSMMGLSETAQDQLEELMGEQLGIRPAEASATLLGVAVRRPLLVVHDADDRYVPLRDGRIIAAAWPGAELIETAGLGHHRILRDPDVIAHVVGFLTRRELARAV